MSRLHLLDALGGTGERKKMGTWELNLGSLVFKQPNPSLLHLSFKYTEAIHKSSSKVKFFALKLFTHTMSHTIYKCNNGVEIQQNLDLKKENVKQAAVDIGACCPDPRPHWNRGTHFPRGLMAKSALWKVPFSEENCLSQGDTSFPGRVSMQSVNVGSLTKLPCPCLNAWSSQQQSW